jgi:hypothetical protein
MPTKLPTGKLFITEGQMMVVQNAGGESLTVNGHPIGSLIAMQLGLIPAKDGGKAFHMNVGKVRIWIERVL